MKLNKITIILAGMLIISSCITNKRYLYLQNKSGNLSDTNSLIKTIPYAYKLQKGDILYISLSTDDERLNKIFVPGTGIQVQIGAGTNSTGTPYYFTGFTIDINGDVELPYLGKVKVTNKTIEEAKASLETALSKFFKIFYIQVKVAEFRYSVLGSVNRPGQFFFTQNKVNIFEAISQAGDLPELANKYQVQLYRQYPDGVKLHILDLTDRSIVSSDYWYIQPNDLLYVQPLKIRYVGNLTSVQNSFGVIAPLLSTLLLVLNTYILIKNLK